MITCGNFTAVLFTSDSLFEALESYVKLFACLTFPEPWYLFLL